MKTIKLLLLTIFLVSPWGAGAQNNNIALPQGLNDTLQYDGIFAPADEGGMLNIYPVPTKDNLDIDLSWDTPQPFDVYIFDIQGAVMDHWQVPTCADYSADVALTWLPDGTYFIRIVGENNAFARHFIIMR